ncbi:LAS seventeen-binding protein 3 [Seminavis robusta]|uniref:LAS seventeen-binding protein 3 n=1 Tax=Seminavis robusta TaxID=568900 RepID=A0A9N8HCT6_9STRA|nr:LAS seventeen-binding protein 3 [Seminavis robusta]|eukprot:Sro428_g140760.1 LAS seventeen-binding protein 3 (257) ;mRNA; f:1477-2247
MDPEQGGISPDLFGPGLLGVSFMTIIEAGFVFSGNVGTGIVLARQPDGSWSPPSAVGISGLGWGVIMGASLKHIVYLIYEPQTIKAMAGDVGVTLGAQVEASIGNWGRTAAISNIISNKGLGSNVGLSYSQGMFGGVSMEGALCNPRTRVNEKFYGKKLTPKQILFSSSQDQDSISVQVPEGTLYPQIVAKLDKLCSGNAIYQPTAEQKAFTESVRQQADKEGEEALAHEHVQYVNVKNQQPVVADGETIFTTLLS